MGKFIGTLNLLLLMINVEDIYLHHTTTPHCHIYLQQNGSLVDVCDMTSRVRDRTLVIFYEKNKNNDKSKN